MFKKYQVVYGYKKLGNRIISGMLLPFHSVNTSHHNIVFTIPTQLPLCIHCTFLVIHILCQVFILLFPVRESYLGSELFS